MFGSLFRLLRPMRLIKRRALMKGVFGGDRFWLGIAIVVFGAGRIKALFGYGEPAPVYTEEVEAGQRVVLAHSEPRRRRRRRR